MDPFSILLKSALSLAQRLSTLAEAEDELVWITNEVTDLSAVLHRFKQLGSSHGESPLLETTTVSSLAKRTEDTLNELQHFINQTFPDPKTGVTKSGKLQFSKRAWIKHERKLPDLKNRLRDCRIAILMLSSEICASQVCTMQYDIRGLLESCRQIMDALQQQNAVHTSQRIIEEATAPDSSSGSSSVGSTSTVVEAINPNQTASTALYNPSPSTVVLRSSRQAPGTYTSTRAFHAKPPKSGAKCGPCCNCQCHTYSYMRSPRWLRQVMGHVVISYNGIPYFLNPSCTLSTCYNRNRSSSLRVSYAFPSTLLSRMLNFTTCWNPVIGIQVTLRAPAVIADTSKTWNIIEKDNPLRLRMAFDGGYAFPTDVDGTGETLLHYAIRLGAYKTAALLLENGADPHAVDGHNKSPSHAAWMANQAMTDDERAMLYSLFSTEEEVIQSFGFTVLHQSIVGIASPAVFDLPAVISPFIDSTDALGWTPLHWAANRSNADALRRLLLLGCNIHALTNRGETALHIACDSGSIECAELLLATGASVSATTAPNSFRTPLHQAAMSKRTSIPLLRLLLQHGAQIEAKDSSGRTPFHLAQGNPNVVRLLLRLGAKVNDLDNDGNTPLVSAVRLGAAGSVALLLQEGSADVGVINRFGQNILHFAALDANLATLKCLARADLQGVDPDAETNNGMTPSQLFFSEVGVVLTVDEGERERDYQAWRELVEKARRDREMIGGSVTRTVPS